MKNKYWQIGKSRLRRVSNVWGYQAGILDKIGNPIRSKFKK
jgi:hypothetical protein